jgi:mRNA interferase MazF
MSKGDIILIPFPFTDLTGIKLRPAVILIVTNYDLTVSFITTQIKWKESTDIELFPSKKSGIKKVSLIRLSKIATVDKSLAVGKLGELQQVKMSELNLKLKKLLQLD